jgi:hypothetical protein
MQSSVVFSHSCPPLDSRDYADAATPVEAPLFSDDAASQALGGPTTS